MIETRGPYQPLLTSKTPPSPGRKMPAAPGPSSSYGTLTLKGEAFLQAEDSASAFKPIRHENGLAPSSIPQSADAGQSYQYGQPVALIPVQQSTAAGGGGVPPPFAGLPPAIPLRRRVDSSGDRSVGDHSIASGASGHNRLQRSTSESGHDFVPLGGSIPPKPRRSSSARSRSPTPTSLLPGGYVQPGHPLHQRRSSDEHSQSSQRHRRTHSFEVPQRGDGLRRGPSSGSLYSLGSQGSIERSESLRLLPDPRWGGGGGGRARSLSGGSREAAGLGLLQSVSYSTDSLEGTTRGSGYGSVAGAKAKEVISGGAPEPLRKYHRRNASEVSTSSFASAASIDRSVEPVVTDMTKSVMLKGVTDEGVVRLQLPKDNFRLLSDRDLESGCVYKRALVENEDEYFQDYHITEPGDEYPPGVPSRYACDYPGCERGPGGRGKQLPPSYYVMAVEPDIYRRMFDEVAESGSMPCKLFYCGHHADVDYPSIKIAAAGVAAVFVVMLWAMVYVGG